MPKIMLDAGHYLLRNNSPVNSLYWESLQMWKLHRMLQAFLELEGFEVGITRPVQQQDLAVYNRGMLAKGYDMFISLHSNACDDESVDRPVVYKPLNASAEVSSLAETLSLCIADIMATSQPGKVKTKRGARGEYYGVMRGAAAAGCPAYYIIEHSFHTNARAAELLLDDAVLLKIAAAEAKIITAYYADRNPASVLRLNSRGAEVKLLQEKLVLHGYIIAVDGIFGVKTRAAVKEFQKEKNLVTDGIVGQKTWTELIKQ